MFYGKMKAVTFSYDDGVIQDRRLVEILNRYGLKGTFNLNSQKLGQKSDRILWDAHINTSKIDLSEVKELYRGHEVASHTLTHPSLATLPIEEALHEVEDDRLALSRIVGYDVVGFAYPNGSVNDNVLRMMDNKTGIKYARWNGESMNFDPPQNLLKLNYTVRHINDALFELADKFIHMTADKPQIFSVWGHAYEFDARGDYDRFERLCELVAGRDDIFYGTGKEVFLQKEKLNG